MSVSVIICTYQAPRELDFALCGISRQSVLPDEVLIADDGSGEQTKQVVERWQSELPCTLVHCWHVDKGYRKARIVNEAVRQSTGDQLIFLDGDSFPHPHWVADHVRAHADGRILCGRRVKLGPVFSEELTRERILGGEFDGIGVSLLVSALRRDTKRLGLGIRIPQPLVRLFHPRSRRLMGVNFGLGREAFYAVNGLNEQWTVYGREDYDLQLRLKRAGFEFYPLLNRGIVYHLFHEERVRSAEALALTAAQEDSDGIRCEVGVEAESGFDPQR